MKSKQISTSTIQQYLSEERIRRIVSSSKKKERLKATKAQKLLLAQDLGILDSIEKFIPGRNKRAHILSILFDEDESNLKKDLSNIHPPVLLSLFRKERSNE